MISISSGARRISVAAICASVLVGCSNQPESTEPTVPAVEREGRPALEAAAPAVVSGMVPTASSSVPSLIVLRPAEARDFPAPASPPIMDQAQLTFYPSVLFVRTGEPTEFRNSDPELHNVRVREEATKEGTFNVAIPTGESYRHTFERDGFYDVGCDIHPGMSAMIVATSTPFTAVADREGHFTIHDVPPGAYIATVQVGGRRFQRPVSVTGGRTELDLSEELPTPES